MRRTDRLYALVEELRARAPRPMSRNDLAIRLEVTPRTVERDILALQQAGVPIWSQRGRGGGYALDQRWTVPPLNLDATEALAVVAALATTQSMPFAEAGRRAQRKLLSSMAATEAAKVRELATRIVADEVAPRPRRRILRAVEEAVIERRVVDLTYQDRDGRPSRRTVEAHGLQLSPDASYLVGWCRLRDAARTFRLDRIAAVTRTDEIAPERQLGAVTHAEEEELVPRRTAWGPPRKAHHRTGSHPAFARAIAGTLLGVEMKKARAGTMFSVGGERFLTLDDEGTAIVRRAPDESETWLLEQVPRDDVRDGIEEAWRSFAPKRSIASHDKKRAKWEALPSATHDDIRRIALALPGANEGPIWGTDLGFRVGSEKKGRFARFGPPVGGKVGNLLPPDDEDTLVLLRCPRRPEMLRARPDLYFTTPHYGDPDEPGGIIVRLAEVRGDDLDELADLIEDAWRAAGGHD